MTVQNGANADLASGLKNYWALFVGDWPQDRDGEMREQRRPFIQLQPADAAMFLQVFSDARFVDAQMLGELFLQVGAFARTAAAAQHVADAHTQGLARLGVVVAGLVVVRNQ